jgi:hypothetical protein
MTDAEDKLKRLYRLVEDGLTDVDEVLKDRLNTLKADRDRAKAALERAKEHSASQIQIDPGLIERFGRTMRESFSTGSVPFRKAYLRSLIDVIEIDDHQVRIKGSKELLEKTVLASQHGQSWCSQTSTRWRSLGDSNPCFRRERRVTGMPANDCEQSDSAVDTASLTDFIHPCSASSGPVYWRKVGEGQPCRDQPATPIWRPAQGGHGCGCAGHPTS